MSDPMREAARVAIAADPEAIHLVGRLVLLDRGEVSAGGRAGHAVLVGGVLITEDGALLSPETLAAGAGSELWEVEIILRPLGKRRSTNASGRGRIDRLIMLAGELPEIWGEVYDRTRRRWRKEES